MGRAGRGPLSGEEIGTSTAGPWVDAHHHVWDPATQRHAWLDGVAPQLRRRFDLDDFTAASAPCGVGASVLVQALASRAETDELLAAASTSAVVRGVVGWVDLTDARVGDVLATMREGPSGSALVGVRHLVHDEADPRWLERPDVVRGLQAVADAGLVYDLLVRPPHLPSAVIAVDGVKGGRFVLDHGGKPAIGAGETEPWAGLVSELAARPNVVAKLSGLVTEAGPTWSPDVIRPYVDHLVGAFGPERLLYGSDWPVCLGEASYADVIGLARSLLDDLLGPPETAMVMTANAVRTYGLGERPR